jgi:hypothetical protein
MPVSRWLLRQANLRYVNAGAISVDGSAADVAGAVAQAHGRARELLATRLG